MTTATEHYARKILVKGPALSRSGYGEQTRFALRALRSRQDVFDIHLINIPWGKTGFVVADDEERAWLDSLLVKTQAYIQQNQDQASFDISLQVTIPNEWENIAGINVGYTAGIETTKVSPVWIGKGMDMNKIVVVSNHSKQVYETSTCVATNHQTGEVIENFHCETPVIAVNYPVRDFEPEEILGFKLDFDFNYLAVAQWGPRKNIVDTINWFVHEFKDEEVGLVLKTNIANDSLLDRIMTEAQLRNTLREHGDHKCKVYLLHGTLSDGQMSWCGADRLIFFVPLTKALRYVLWLLRLITPCRMCRQKRFGKE